MSVTVRDVDEVSGLECSSNTWTSLFCFFLKIFVGHESFLWGH